MTNIEPVDLGGSRVWSITVEVLRDGMPVAITQSMRAGEPMDGSIYSARITRRITRTHAGASESVTEYAPTIIEHKSNARENVYLRALRMAISARRKLARLHSVSERSDGVNIPLLAPMLAVSLHPPDAIDGIFTNAHASLHVFVQRKYDGLRAIGTVDGAGIPILYGRRAIIFTSPAVARIKSELARIVQRGIYIDGELYVHGMSLQEIESAATNKQCAAASTSLNFIAYDMFTLESRVVVPFSARLAQLRALLDAQEANAAIRCAETFACERDTKCVRDLFARFLREGYEGAIARIDGREYEHGRSSALIKIKLAHDAEFRVVAFTSALHGASRGALMFVCEISEGGATFTVTPTGSISARRALMKQMQTAQGTQFSPTNETQTKWLGKYIIVKFDALSRDGIPLRARTDGTIREVA